MTKAVRPSFCVQNCDVSLSLNKERASNMRLILDTPEELGSGGDWRSL